MFCGNGGKSIFEGMRGVFEYVVVLYYSRGKYWIF